MSQPPRRMSDHRSVELDGIRYVILREAAFELLCQKAHVPCRHAHRRRLYFARSRLRFDQFAPQKLVRRRAVRGPSQAELARRRGVRPETLNRIERGRTDTGLRHSSQACP